MMENLITSSKTKELPPEPRHSQMKSQLEDRVVGHTSYPPQESLNYFYSARQVESGQLTSTFQFLVPTVRARAFATACSRHQRTRGWVVSVLS